MASRGSWLPLTREMKNPGGIESAGAYKANSSVRLVSPPVELPNQRGGDRLDIRVHVFGESCLHTRIRKYGLAGAVEARESVFGAPEEASRHRQTEEPR